MWFEPFYEAQHRVECMMREQFWVSLAAVVGGAGLIAALFLVLI